MLIFTSNNVLIVGVPMEKIILSKPWPLGGPELWRGVYIAFKAAPSLQALVKCLAVYLYSISIVEFNSSCQSSFQSLLWLKTERQADANISIPLKTRLGLETAIIQAPLHPANT